MLRVEVNATVGVRVLPKWQVVEEQGLGYNKTTTSTTVQPHSDFGGPLNRRRATSSSCDNTLDPKSKRGRVTIQTDKGPRDVSGDEKLYPLSKINSHCQVLGNLAKPRYTCAQYDPYYDIGHNT